MGGENRGLFGGDGMSGIGQATELDLQSTAIQAAWPVRRPEVEAAIGRLVGASPATYGYRRLHALLKRQGLLCDPKTVWAAMRRRGWLST
jgi:hypothetical protein